MCNLLSYMWFLLFMLQYVFVVQFYFKKYYYFLIIYYFVRMYRLQNISKHVIIFDFCKTFLFFSTQVQELAKEQETWLDKQLEEAKSGKYKHIIIFQHIPWFLKDPDEEKQYFNILPELRLKMLQKFHDASEYFFLILFL